MTWCIKFIILRTLQTQGDFMNKLFALALILASNAAFANDYNEICMNRYRDATYAMVDNARAFNNGGMSSAQLLAEFSLVESQIGAKRLICALEDESIKDCVRLYKKQYHKIRSEIDLISIANGSQDRIKVGLIEAGLGIADLRCQ